MPCLFKLYEKTNAEMRAQVAYWKEHPLPREEALRRLKLLREQRLALQNKLRNNQ